MNKIFLLLLVVLNSYAYALEDKVIGMEPKAAIKIDYHTSHGETRIDNYNWLRDDSRTNKDVLNYLTLENNYTINKLASSEELRSKIFYEMAMRIPMHDVTVPFEKQGYKYTAVFEGNNDYAKYLRQNINTGALEVLFDSNERASCCEYYSLSGYAVSRDNRYLAVGEDTLSRNNFRIQIRDLQKEEWLSDSIENTSGNFIWAADGNSLLYVQNHLKTLRPWRVYKHTIGTPVAQDKLIYEEADERFTAQLFETSSKKYILIGLKSQTTNDYLLLDSIGVDNKPMHIIPRMTYHRYDIDHLDDHFYFKSNKGSTLFGLYKSHEKNVADWTTILEPTDDIALGNFTLKKDWIVNEEMYKGNVRLRQTNLSSGEQSLIEFDEPHLSGIYEAKADDNKLRYFYSSLTSPFTVNEIDLNTKDTNILKQEPVFGYDRKNYDSTRIMITARDGTEVPVSLVWRKDKFNKDGQNPLLIVGYGAYGVTIDPAFDANRLSLLDRGFVYAIAHVRGGLEGGESWYESGRLLSKKNTFTDFIDVTKGLVAQNYGASDRVYAKGGSAGGLLIGAVINEAPELYKGVIANVPFVDVLTTMFDESLPLTIAEYDEWGNPNNKEYYDYIKSYSPYDQVTSQAYPHIYVTSGLYDSQVQYWESAKWVAKLRELKTDNNLLLLRTNMTAGHDGKSGRFSYLEDESLAMVFLLKIDGITE